MNKLAVAGVVVVLLSACQPAQMRVPAALAEVPAMTVDGANPRTWNTPIGFGAWRTTTAREGLKWGFGLRLLGITAGYATQPYRLVVAGNGHTLQAECVTRAVSVSRSGLEVDPAFGKLPALACGFDGSGSGTLRLRNTALNAENGSIEFGDATWTVHSVNRYEGSSLTSSEPLGYEIRRGGAVLAGVETINRGRVWIDPALNGEQQARLATVITALLLYVPAREDS